MNDDGTRPASGTGARARAEGGVGRCDMLMLGAHADAEGTCDMGPCWEVLQPQIDVAAYGTVHDTGHDTPSGRVLIVCTHPTGRERERSRLATCQRVCPRVTCLPWRRLRSCASRSRAWRLG